MKPSRSVTPEDLEAAVSSEAQAAGFSQAAAEAIAEFSVCAMCTILGGSQIYWPKRFLQRYRDHVIYQLANGHNTAELAAEHGVSARHIARIIRRGRQAKGSL